MPKSKSAMMKRLYQSRKDAGLVLFKAWVTPKIKQEYERILETSWAKSSMANHNAPSSKNNK